jgi:transposase
MGDVRDPNGRIPISAEARATLAHWARAPMEHDRRSQRARLILACAEGVPLDEAARGVGLSPQAAERWIGRFLLHGLAGLLDRPRAGRPLEYDDSVRARVFQILRQMNGSASLTRLERLAREAGLPPMSRSTLYRLRRLYWEAEGNGTA